MKKITKTTAKKAVKNTTKKTTKPSFIIDYTKEFNHPIDFLAEVGIAKVRCGVAITKDELLTIMMFVASNLIDLINSLANYDEKCIKDKEAMTSTKQPKKKSWFKRIWNKLIGK